MNSRSNFSRQLKIGLLIGGVAAVINFFALFVNTGMMLSYAILVAAVFVFYKLTSVFALGWTILNAILNIAVFVLEFSLLNNLPLQGGLLTYLILFVIGVLLFVLNKKILDLIFERFGVKVKPFSTDFSDTSAR